MFRPLNETLLANLADMVPFGSPYNANVVAIPNSFRLPTAARL